MQRTRSYLNRCLSVPVLVLDQLVACQILVAVATLDEKLVQELQQVHRFLLAQRDALAANKNFDRPQARPNKVTRTLVGRQANKQNGPQDFFALPTVGRVSQNGPLLVLRIVELRNFDFFHSFGAVTGPRLDTKRTLFRNSHLHSLYSTHFPGQRRLSSLREDGGRQGLGD